VIPGIVTPEYFLRSGHERGTYTSTDREDLGVFSPPSGSLMPVVQEGGLFKILAQLLHNKKSRREHPKILLM
jgi:hypothetical protein